MSEDLYGLLGVAKDADEKTLKSAYRKAAMQYHPDRNPGDAEAEKRFKEISQAYAILSDPQKRSAYDRFGMAAFQGGMDGARADAFGAQFGASFADVFDDLFGEFVGGRGGRARRGGPQRGSDLRYDLEITLEEAFSGRDVEVEFTTRTTCETCNGSGAAPGSKPQTCDMCGGAGRVRMTQGFFTVERTCPRCQGRGVVITDPCKDCGGAGRKETKRKLSVTIPPGVDDGTRIRISGEGEAGPKGGPAGDLYVFIALAPHDIFERDGPNLFCTAPVSMVDAALGGEAEIPVIDGARAKVKIADGAQSGQRFRLRGKGMPSVRNQKRGDLIVELVVETPVNLTDRQKELLRQFAAESDGDTHHPAKSGFLKRAKAFWDSVRPHA